MNKRNIKNITIDFVEDTKFSTKLMLCISKIQEDATTKCEDASVEISNMMQFFTEKDMVVDEIYWNYRAVINCLKSIYNSIFFIKNYDKRDYMQDEYIAFDEFCLYHYDVICHKIATIKDLYFKLVDKLYDLKLEKVNWKELKKQKDKINNEQLFYILEEYFRVSKSLEEQRHASSHDGKITLRLLNDFSIVQMQVYLREHTNIPDSSKEDLYDRKSKMYYFQMIKARAKALQFLYVIRYNTSMATKEFFNSLSCKLCSRLRELYPNEDFELKENNAVQN